MSDLFVQVSALASGTTTAQVTLTSVVAGNTIVAFFGNGSNASPAVLSVADDRQGTYATPGAQVKDTPDAVVLQAFTLANASSGTHVITGTTDSTNGCDLIVVEIGSTAGVSAVSGANQASQVSPGTGTDALSSGTVTITGAATLVCYCLDSASTLTVDEPAAGTGFTSRANAQSPFLGVYRLSTIAASADRAANATAVAGTGAQTFETLGVAVLNAGTSTSLGAVKQPGPGVSPSRRDQFRAKIGATPNLGTLVTVNQTVGAYTWAGTTSTAGTLAQSFAAIQGPGPGLRSPFNPLQFVADPRGIPASTLLVFATPGTWTWAGTTSTTSQLVNAAVGTYSWAGTTGTTSQLVNAIPGTWSWAGTTGVTSQLVNATPGTWSWAGTTAGTTQLVNAAPGAYTWAGTTAGTTQLVNAGVGAWSWSGTTATFGAAIQATPGTWSWAGVDAQIPTQITLTPGAYSWSGTTAGVQVGPTILVGPSDGDEKRKKRKPVVYRDERAEIKSALVAAVEALEPAKPIVKPKSATPKPNSSEPISASEVAKALGYETPIDWDDEDDIEMLLLSL